MNTNNRRNALLVVLGMTLFGAGIGCSKKTASQQTETHVHQKYRCPMHPTYISDKPGECPICHMTLVPFDQDSGTENSDGSANSSSADSSHAAITLSPEREQLIGVKVTPVEKRELEIKIRASGRVAYDPELQNALIEYKESVATAEKAKSGAWKESEDRAASLVKASEKRLLQMGITVNEARALIHDKNFDTNFLAHEPGEPVWIYAQVFQNEAFLVKKGSLVEVTSSAFPGKTLAGHVRAIDSVMNAETRTLNVRAEIQDPRGLLKPEMFVDAVIHISLGKKLAIPNDAVMNTGERTLVFVKTKPGIYEPRDVKLGHQTDDFYELLSGVDENESIVTSANFLIDSESRIKAAVSGAR